MEVDAAQLLSITKALQGGSDLEANSLDGSPQFNVGAYLNIKGDGNIFDITVEEVEDQVQNDVSFLITPAIFDLTAFERVLQKVKHLNVPIIASVILLKSVATARFLNKHVDNVYVPDTIIERLYTAGDKQKESMTITAELINGMKNLCHGVNIMAMGWEDKIALYLDAAHI